MVERNQMDIWLTVSMRRVQDISYVFQSRDISEGNVDGGELRMQNRINGTSATVVGKAEHPATLRVSPAGWNTAGDTNCSCYSIPISGWWLVVVVVVVSTGSLAVMLCSCNPCLRLYKVIQWAPTVEVDNAFGLLHQLQCLITEVPSRLLSGFSRMGLRLSCIKDICNLALVCIVYNSS